MKSISCTFTKSHIPSYSFHIYTMNYLQATSILFLTIWIASNGDVRIVRILNGTQVYIREYSKNYLQCKVFGDEYSIQWAKRNGTGSLTPLINSNSTQLFFNNFTSFNNGSYACQAKGQYDDKWTDSRDSQVVAVPSEYVLSVRILNSSEVTIPLNHNDSLLCISDRSNSQFRWATKSFYGTKIIPEATAPRLLLNKITAKDEGRYQCQAKTVNQSYWAVSAEIKIRVANNVTENVKLLNESSVEIQIRSTHNYLLCQADGLEPQYRWAKVSYWGQIYPIENSSSNRYNFINASLTDEERYICQAKSLGQQTWITSNVVYVKILSGDAMVWIVNNSMIYIRMGTTGAHLQCGSAVSALEYRWVKSTWWSEKVPLPKSNDNQLHLPPISWDVAGKYACQVSVLTTFGKINWLTSSFVEVRAVGGTSESSRINPTLSIILTFVLLNEIIKILI